MATKVIFHKNRQSFWQHRLWNWLPL